MKSQCVSDGTPAVLALVDEILKLGSKLSCVPVQDEENVLVATTTQCRKTIHVSAASTIVPVTRC